MLLKKSESQPLGRGWQRTQGQFNRKIYFLNFLMRWLESLFQDNEKILFLFFSFIFQADLCLKLTLIQWKIIKLQKNYCWKNRFLYLFLFRLKKCFLGETISSVFLNRFRWKRGEKYFSVKSAFSFLPVMVNR